MKRALALAFAALLFGVVGLAQISGSWSGKLALLPNLSFSYTQLVLNTTVAGFEISSTSKFTSSGFESQKFSISGAFGPTEVSGVMGFDAAAPAYAYTDLSTSLSFAGVDITGKVFHGVYPYGQSYFEKNYAPLKWTDVCPTPQTGSTLMLYTLETSVEPISVSARFSDCCEGIEFYDLTITLEDLSLCCGIAYDLKFYFTKDGFEYVLVSIDPLFELCCGISFGVDVKFTVDAKEVTPSFSWGGIEGCVTVWGDVVQTGTQIAGWELYGYKIFCELAECYSFEIVTAFNVPEVEAIIGDVFKGDEFEYIAIGACGPACCGGTWTLDVTVFFGGGTLFDISRFLVETEVPLMDALSVSLDFGYDVPKAEPSFTVGWTFTF